MIDERITCERCIAKLVKAGGHGHVADHYDVGNPATPDMGHAMFFAKDGRIALCIADERTAD